MDDLRIKQKIDSFADTVTSQLRDDDTRNQLLLGIAGVAIAAALGIACQKRISGTSQEH